MGKSFARIGVFAAVLLILDQLTKLWAQSVLPQGREIKLIGDFLTLKLTYNSGAAFSFGSGTTWIFTLISAAVVLALPFFVYRIPLLSYRLILAAVWAGACGNLLDRLLRKPGFGIGHVVDFINYNGLFVGNVADIFLVVGLVVLSVSECFGVCEGKETPDNPSAQCRDACDAGGDDPDADISAGEDACGGDSAWVEA